MPFFSFIATQTQSSGSGEDKPPDSTASSETSLGKRKACDISPSSTMSSGPFRPPKNPRSIPQCEEDKSPDNPFIDHGPPKLEVPENPFTPVIIVRLFFSACRRISTDAHSSLQERVYKLNSRRESFLMGFNMRLHVTLRLENSSTRSSTYPVSTSSLP